MVIFQRAATQVVPQSGYTMQITAQHRHEPVEQFFVLAYQIQIRTMWFLGAISRARFLESAVDYGAGEKVQPKYQAREGHEIYNTDGRFQAPAAWLESIQKDVVPHV